MYTQIKYEVADRVGVITLNRPEYRNAIGRIMIEELDDVFDRALADDDVGVVALVAEGPHFSAGHDLGTPAKLADDEARPFPPGVPGTFLRSWSMYIEPGLRWRNFPKPTVCGVHGMCVFGGWMLAATMDVLFAAEDANFLPSRLQYFSMPWDIGVRKAKEVLLEPRFIDAKEAVEYGFVTRVYSVDTLREETLGYAKRVAENDPFYLWTTKLAINQAQDTQGYTTHINDAHAFPMGGGGRSSQGGQLPSGQRRIAPIDRALRNQQLMRDHVARS